MALIILFRILHTIPELMKRIILFLLIICCLSCQKSEKQSGKVDQVKSYINALNEGKYSEITRLFKDSIRLKEIVYQSSFSKEAYYDLFQWDSTFHPTYSLLEIEQKGEEVHMRVSKEGPRILFLNEEPIITREVVQFEDDLMIGVTITNYEVFNDSTWSEKRAKLIDWIATYKPELDGFIYDQTKDGALKYLKAISAYQQSHQTN